MSRDLKYLNEENMVEIIISCTYHTSLNTLRSGKYTQEKRKYLETHKAGMVAVQILLSGHTRKNFK
jgi:hypothetical protein